MRVSWPGRHVAELDIPGLVRVLNRFGVRYVVIGGAAALVPDLPLPATVDLDVTPAPDRENLSRLADAFDEIREWFVLDSDYYDGLNAWLDERFEQWKETTL